MPRHAPDDAYRAKPAPITDDTPLFAPPPAPSIPRRAAPVDELHLPVIQWASGHTDARTTASRFGPLVGSHSEVGRDAALDEAATAAGTPQMDIRHPRAGGPGEIKRHWAFGESLLFFPLTAGPPARTISACIRQHALATAESGIGLAWPVGSKSRMAVRGYLLLAHTPVAVQLAVRSTMTSALLAALLQHLADCETADTLIDRARHPAPVACHELAMLLVAGDEVSVGSGETSLITPFLATPLEEDKAALAIRWRPATIDRAAVTDWAATQAWAAGYASGETNGDSHLSDDEPR